MDSNSKSSKDENILFTRNLDSEDKKRLKNHYLTVLAKDPDSFLKDLSGFVKICGTRKAIVLLDIIEREKCGHMLLAYREKEDETILHTATIYNDDNDIIKKIINICPTLMVEERKKSINYCGQTALHIAIAKGNVQAVKTILLKARSCSADLLRKLLHIEAVGLKFTNTVMMGEVPLNIAALKRHQEMIDTLIDNGAEMDYQNSRGDTIFHSLVRYSAIHPDKLLSIIEVIDFIQNRIQKHEKNEKESKKQEVGNKFQCSIIWFRKNKDGYSALQLAAKLGVVNVFLHIINIRDIYCFANTRDGLFDINNYDVTEVDTVSNYLSNNLKIAKTNDVIQNENETSSEDQTAELTDIYFTENHATESVLEMIYENTYQRSSALRMIKASPVKDIVKEKWRFFRWILYIWMVIHLWFVSSLTVYSVERMPLFFVKNVNLSEDMTSGYQKKLEFAIGFQWMSFVMGILYFTISLKSIVAIFLRHNALSYSFKNIGYVFILFAFSVSIAVDTFWTYADKSHDSVPLICAIILGWAFNLFFLRCFQSFSVFVELITRAAIGDLVRFAAVIIMDLIAFTTGMHIMFQTDGGSQTRLSNTYQSYGSTMMMMFKLMLGFEDIELLHKTRAPWLAVVLFITFTALTYFLIFNTLIAMLSHTWSLLAADKYSQWRIQQLSVILFLEEIFILDCLKPLVPVFGETENVSVFDFKTKTTKSYSRRFLEIHAKEIKFTNEEDKEGLKTNLFVSQLMMYNKIPSVTLSAYGHDNRKSSSFRDSSIQTTKEEFCEKDTPNILITKKPKSILKKRPHETACPDKRKTHTKITEINEDVLLPFFNSENERCSAPGDEDQDDNSETLYSKQIKVEVHSHFGNDTSSIHGPNVRNIGPPAIDIQQVLSSD